MAKKKRNSKIRSSAAIVQTLQFEIFGLILLGFSIISLANLGAVSKACRYVAKFFMGDLFILLLLGIMAFAIYLMYKRELPDFLQWRIFGSCLITAAILLMAHIYAISSNEISFDQGRSSVILQTWDQFWTNVSEPASTLKLGGGMVGAVLYAVFHFLFDTTGSKIAAIFLALIGVILVTGWSFNDILTSVFRPIKDFFTRFGKSTFQDAKRLIEKAKSEKAGKIEEEYVEEPEDGVDYVVDLSKRDVVISNFSDRFNLELDADHPTESVNLDHDSETLKSSAENDTETRVEKDRSKWSSHYKADYQLPPLSLLQPSKKKNNRSEKNMIQENAKKLEQTLASFGVRAAVTEIHIGPAVTQYELYPEVGVKVSRIVSLTDDIALALAAKDIRIEAPIPGKSAIGIEVPNSQVAMVTLRDVLEETKQKGHLIRFALGKDISGNSICAELNKMPHLLVAGATGSGKSVCINGIITSILMRAKPHEVKMMMIDPKMVELNVYNGIPHLLAPVVTDPKRAAQALKKIVNEMERRYEAFSYSGTRNIEGYNDLIRRQNTEEGLDQPLLPYIVVLVDELADLMMVASSDVEDAIIRLAQMARAAGIHLIIATQRPSVDVITGIIKANIPSRIAFSVSSSTDSRTILDMGGAEKLLGRGDMLFYPTGASKPIRVQGAFLSDQEVEDVVEFITEQQSAEYQTEMIPEEVTEDVQESEDELYNEAVQLVVEMQTASVSLLQRRFRIGYSRAARLIDEMEQRGVVGPYEGSKPRTVLLTKKE